MAAKGNQEGAGQGIIRNMGLFWRHDRVRWRKYKGKKRLAGERALSKGEGEVDLWDQVGIYALYADYHLVYVGQAGLSDKSCLGNRLKQHLTDDLAGRWNMFSWFGLRAVRKGDNQMTKKPNVKLTSPTHLANVLEGILIEVAEPPQNSQKGRFGKRVERYVQMDVGESPEKCRHEELMQAISKLQKQGAKKKGQVPWLRAPGMGRQTGRGPRGHRRRLARMKELMERGFVKQGDSLLIRNHGEDSEAIVIDHKKVRFRGGEMRFNEWGEKVLGWRSICIYDWAVPKGRNKTLSQLRAEATGPQ